MTDPTSAAALDLGGLARALHDHQVVYVVIGGYATILHGAPYVTNDIDICPSGDALNCNRLAHALTALDARLLLSRPRLTVMPYDWLASVAEWSRWPSFRTVTTAGEVDIVFEADGPGGSTLRYADFAHDGSVFDLALPGGRVDVPAAALETVIASKEAAGRDKDRAVLPLLRRLRQRLADG